MKKTRKAISAPLGVIFGVLLAIILVVLATFIAFNISTTAVKSQSGQLVVVGQPVAFYSSSGTSKYLEKLSFTVKNPSGDPVKVTGVIVNATTINFDTEVTVNGQSSGTIEITWSSSDNKYKYAFGTQTGDTDATSKIDITGYVNNGYVDFVIVTDRGTVSAVAQPIETG